MARAPLTACLYAHVYALYITREPAAPLQHALQLTWASTAASPSSTNTSTCALGGMTKCTLLWCKLLVYSRLHTTLSTHYPTQPLCASPRDYVRLTAAVLPSEAAKCRGVLLSQLPQVASPPACSNRRSWA